MIMMLDFSDRGKAFPSKHVLMTSLGIISSVFKVLGYKLITFAFLEKDTQISRQKQDRSSNIVQNALDEGDREYSANRYFISSASTPSNLREMASFS